MKEFASFKVEYVVQYELYNHEVCYEIVSLISAFRLAVLCICVS
jgi:hypothetical protein